MRSRWPHIRTLPVVARDASYGARRRGAVAVLVMAWWWRGGGGAEVVAWWCGGRGGCGGGNGAGVVVVVVGMGRAWWRWWWEWGWRTIDNEDLALKLLLERLDGMWSFSQQKSWGWLSRAVTGSDSSSGSRTEAIAPPNEQEKDVALSTTSFNSSGVEPNTSDCGGMNVGDPSHPSMTSTLCTNTLELTVIESWSARVEAPASVRRRQPGLSGVGGGNQG